MDYHTRDFRVLQFHDLQEFVVYEAVMERLLPGSYRTKSQALWACVEFKTAWDARVRAEQSGGPIGEVGG